jgi:hypothetical protein
LQDKALRIYRRLGVETCNDLFTASKPKGMHRKTYEKLVDEAQSLEEESLYAICKMLKCI